MRRKYLVIVFMLAAIPCFSQGMGTNAGCNFAGTWYGGSPDAPSPYYQLTINPISADRFSEVAQFVPEVQSLGYLRGTDWTGEFSKTGPHTYSGIVHSEWQWDPSSPNKPDGVDASLPEMDFIHIKTAEFLDCDTIQFKYDWVAVYFNFTYDIKPLQTPPTPPGFVVNFDPLLLEVYHRVPTSASDDFMAAGVSSASAPSNPRKGGRKSPLK